MKTPAFFFYIFLTSTSVGEWDLSIKVLSTLRLMMGGEEASKGRQCRNPLTVMISLQWMVESWYSHVMRYYLRVRWEVGNS